MSNQSCDAVAGRRSSSTPVSSSSAHRFILGLIGALPIVLLGLLASSGTANAATDLVPHGCIAHTGSALAGCEPTADGLDNPVGLAISPEGDSLYAVAQAGAIVRFDRDVDTGELIPQGCIEDAGQDLGCEGTAEGLIAPNEVTVSPDGESVYVASKGSLSSNQGGTIAHFDRDPETGALTPRGCLTDATHPVQGCEDTYRGIGPATGIVVASDGESVYVSTDFGSADSFPTGNAILEFDRDTLTGDLSGRACIAQASDLWNCGTTEPGLNRPNGVVLSPDGNSLYVPTIGADSVVAFDRGANGALAGVGCVQDDVRTPICESEQEGLRGASDAAVSPDGRSVYVASNFDFALAWLHRNGSTGALTGRACYAGSKDRCPPAGVRGLERPSGVAVPDNSSVYATASQDSTLVRFARDSTGALDWRGCFADPDFGAEEGCGDTQQGLQGAQDLVVSPDGSSIYVAGKQDDAIVSFGIEPKTWIASGRRGPINDPSPEFELRSDQPSATFECQIDDGDFAPCSSPLTLGPLADGRHTFAVRAVNGAGDVDQSPASRRFNVDTAAPTASISCPPAPDPSTSPVRCTAGWNDPGTEPSSVPLGGIVYGLDTDPSTGTNYEPHFYRGPFDVTGVGRWDVLVIAVDRAGNASEPATVEVTIEAGGPKA